jgi:hypothetical protein
MRLELCTPALNDNDTLNRKETFLSSALYRTMICVYGEGVTFVYLYASSWNKYLARA